MTFVKSEAVRAPRVKLRARPSCAPTKEQPLKSDLELKTDVTAELLWDPAVNATNVGVAVRDGIVTLSGQVDNNAQKHAAERAVMRVAGVHGIALDIEVRLAPDGKRSDAEIALGALHALRWHSVVPDHKIQVDVEHGHVTLKGEVDWDYERASAEHCIRPLIGVAGVRNLITIKARADVADIGAQITAALRRHAVREANHIRVDVEGGVVTLSGQVDSLPEHDAVVGTAYAARGVSRVVDKLQVGNWRRLSAVA
jgi:osmotically-inducible protein OsmY